MSSPSTDELIKLAESQSVRVMWHHAGPKGIWVPEQHIISIRVGLGQIAERCTLAHELGHAHYGHPGGCQPRHEGKADRFAAGLLISDTKYATAETLYGPRPPIIAAELGVTTHLLEVWRTSWVQRCA